MSMLADQAPAPSNWFQLHSRPPQRKCNREFHRAFRAVCALAPSFLPEAEGITYATAVSQRPQRRATEDGLWMLSSRLRGLAILASVELLGLTQAEASRAARMSRAAVSIAIRRVQQDLQRPRIERLYDAVEQSLCP
ncbi:hypothetical protein PWG15_05340 [Ensifer adhaerens]|uniref:hypothetical protein n=1 Tax=Ensifer adhaerens TaxID=106592 RepID=UPI0023A9CA06|nr:hypothetical protein [Ensifer adhaerens]WDZ77929.1 hypothetical protein PWG15_05340 [Ensifer adhaerens]